jgi:hypothetical protein
MALTDTAIRKAKPKEKLGDDGKPLMQDGKPVLLPRRLVDERGLYLEMRSTGAKLWWYRYRIDGKENVFAIGEYCAPRDAEIPKGSTRTPEARRFSLDEARQERIKARNLVRRGIHPAQHRDDLIAERKAEKANTFEAVAKEWLENNRHAWTAAVYEAIKNRLEREVFPDIGHKPIREVKNSDVRVILDRLAARGVRVTATNVRQHCGSIFRYAIDTDQATGDPTVGLKRHELPFSCVTSHCSALALGIT